MFFTRNLLIRKSQMSRRFLASGMRSMLPMLETLKSKPTGGYWQPWARLRACSKDGGQSHTFFAVHDIKIVSERCHFSSEEPLILIQEKEDDPIWHSHPQFDEAVVRYWYRKFYSETMVGNLMVLRPDKPILYYYDRATSKDTVRDVQFVTLVKAYRLLWIVVVLLAAIALPPIKEYMFILAGVLLFDLFWRIWATRKIGQD